MGYTHYWQWKSPLAKTKIEKFALWSRDVQILLEYYPDLQPHWAFLDTFPLPETWDSTVRGPYGDGEPIFDDERVAFNGDRETGNAHETFIIERSNLYETNFFPGVKPGTIRMTY